jgi:hypothetical protein
MDSGDTLVVGMGATTQDVVLSASVAAGATSLSITSVTPTADFAVGTPVTDLTTPGANLDGSVWTVTRGAEGTTPVTHGSGFTVNNVVTAGSIPNNLVAPLELPATTSDPLTTQGGNTLDDGSGNAVVNGDLTIDTATIETEWRNPPGQTFGKISLSLANITGQNGILLKQTSVNPVDIETVTTHPGDVVTSIRHEPRPGFTIGPAIPEIQVGPPGAAWVGISSAGLFSVSHVNPNPALPALPTNPPVSGTVYQNTTGGPILIAVPVTGGSVADTAQWALGSTDTPADWGGADTVAIDEVKTIHLTVPNGWYWSLTTGATIGTADVLGS